MPIATNYHKVIHMHANIATIYAITFIDHNIIYGMTKHS